MPSIASAITPNAAILRDLLDECLVTLVTPRAERTLLLESEASDRFPPPACFW